MVKKPRVNPEPPNYNKTWIKTTASSRDFVWLFELIRLEDDPRIPKDLYFYPPMTQVAGREFLNNCFNARKPETVTKMTYTFAILIWKQWIADPDVTWKKALYRAASAQGRRKGLVKETGRIWSGKWDEKQKKLWLEKAALDVTSFDYKSWVELFHDEYNFIKDNVTPDRTVEYWPNANEETDRRKRSLIKRITGEEPRARGPIKSKAIRMEQVEERMKLYTFEGNTIVQQQSSASLEQSSSTSAVVDISSSSTEDTQVTQEED